MQGATHSHHGTGHDGEPRRGDPDTRPGREPRDSDPHQNLLSPDRATQPTCPQTDEAQPRHSPRSQPVTDPHRYPVVTHEQRAFTSPCTMRPIRQTWAPRESGHFRVLRIRAPTHQGSRQQCETRRTQFRRAPVESRSCRQIRASAPWRRSPDLPCRYSYRHRVSAAPALATQSNEINPITQHSRGIIDFKAGCNHSHTLPTWKTKRTRFHPSRSENHGLAGESPLQPPVQRAKTRDKANFAEAPWNQCAAEFGLLRRCFASRKQSEPNRDRCEPVPGKLVGGNGKNNTNPISSKPHRIKGLFRTIRSEHSGPASYKTRAGVSSSVLGFPNDGGT